MVNRKKGQLSDEVNIMIDKMSRIIYRRLGKEKIK